MKYLIHRQLLILIVGMIISSHRALTQPLAEPPTPPHVWGAASNGISGGLCIRQSDLYCDIDVRNMTTNSMYIWVPRLDQRYEIELRGPDGQQIRQIKPFSSNPNWRMDWSHWLGRQPYIQDPFPEKRNLNWFYIKDVFDLKTNGIHTLIVQVRANAFTNFAIGRSKMRENKTYFLLPPVTNTFNILLP